MPDTDARQGGSADSSRSEQAVSEAVSTTESYETEDGVVFYDAENPLAWIQSRVALDIEALR